MHTLHPSLLTLEHNGCRKKKKKKKKNKQTEYKHFNCESNAFSWQLTVNSNTWIKMHLKKKKKKERKKKKEGRKEKMEA